MKNPRKGFTLVEIMIVVAIIALLAAIAIPNLVRARIHANDAAAIKILKALAVASDMYSTLASNSGNYPADMTALVGPAPPYISTNYCGSTTLGYTFTCNNSPGSYTYTATPTAVGVTGTTTYTITVGGVVSP